MINAVTRFPTTDKAKAIHSALRKNIKKNIRAKWDGCALKIHSIKDLEVKYVVHVFSYKIFQSSKQKSVPS